MEQGFDSAKETIEKTELETGSLKVLILGGMIISGICT